MPWPINQWLIGDKPNEPGWGIPDGGVEAADLAYFLAQYTQNNQRIANLTTSNNPKDPLFGVLDGFLNDEDVKYFEALHTRSLGRCRR